MILLDVDSLDGYNGVANTMKAQKSLTPAQLAQMTQFERVHTRHFENKAEELVVNFTRIPESLLELLLKGPQNYTDLNDPTIKSKLEEGISASDRKDVTIADLRRQLDWLKNEEKGAQQYFVQQEQQAQHADAENERQKTENEEAEKRNAPIQVSTKQKRGMLGGTRRRKTAETAAAFGKQ